MKIKQNSLHLRLFEYYARGDMWSLENNALNFCQYARRAILGVFVAFLVTLMGVALGASIMQGIGTVLLWAFTDNEWMPFIGAQFPPFAPPYGGWIGAIGMMAWILVSCVLAIGAFALATFITVNMFCLGDSLSQSWKYKRQAANSRKLSEPGFVKTWYLSWKFKYCPIVSLEKKDEQ